MTWSIGDGDLEVSRNKRDQLVVIKPFLGWSESGCGRDVRITFLIRASTQ